MGLNYPKLKQALQDVMSEHKPCKIWINSELRKEINKHIFKYGKLSNNRQLAWFLKFQHDYKTFKNVVDNITNYILIKSRKRK